MANTVSLINLSDTFGVWITRTNDLAKENNDIAANNYVKPTGTLFLNEPNLGLQVANNAFIKGGLQVTGTGSYLRVDNNITANGQVYFTNPNLGLTNYGELFSNGKISASGSNIGLAVSNNTTIGGYLTVANTLSVTKATALGNTLSVSKATTLSDTLGVTGATTLGNTLSVTENSTFSNNITVTNKTSTYDFFATNDSNTRTLTVRTSGSVLLDLSIDRNTFANVLQANSSVNTRTLSVTGQSYTNTLQANSAVITTNSVASSNSFTNILQANNAVITSTIAASGTSFVNILQANSSVNTRTLSVTGQSYTDILQANTSMNTGSFATSTLFTLGQATVSILQANNTVNSTLITASSAIVGNNITANSSITAPIVYVTNRINADASDLYINNINAQGRLSVLGDFVINGTTIYNSPAMTLSAVTPNQIGFINVFRTANGAANGVAANATIRWNESALPSPYWDIKDVGTGTYYRIITEQQVLDTLNSTSSITAASSKAANTLNNSVITLNAALNSNVTSLQNQINSNVTSLQAQITSNVTSLQAQITSNAAISSIGINAAYTRANASSQLFNGTTGSAAPTTPAGALTLTSTNGVTVSGAGSTLTINTPQNLRTTDTPTFNNLNLTAPLPITSGGTGQTTAGGSLTALLPGGTTAGYVLTTGGPGNFYWAAGGGGGGGSATPGTTINSSRLSYTATAGQTTFISPPFTTATQVRVYINGVRQTSDYTENTTTLSGVTIIGTAGQFSCTSSTLSLNQAIVITGNFGGTGSITGYVPGKTYYIILTNGSTTFTLSESLGGSAITTTSGTPTGLTYTTGYSITLANPAYLNDAVLVEVDGFIINPYYANNIAYTVNSLIGPTANTIQLAIDGLASLYAPLASPTFTGTPLVPTAGVGTNTTQIASTKFVNDTINSGSTYTHSITGNSGTTSQTNFSNLTIGGSQVVTAANYNSYAPTLTGTGASGSWNISAAQLGGLSLQSTSAISASQVARSDGSGYMNFGYINSNTNNSEDPTVSQVIVTNGTDNFYRKSSISSFTSAVQAQASGSWNILSAKSSTLSQGGGNGTGMTFNWSGQAGQPTWLWGGNDGTNHYVYNPLNFNVNYSTTSGTAARATRANGNLYIDDNYGYGIVGAYSASRFQGIFAMGDAYKLPADGTSTGSLYGLAWSYPSAGGAASNLDSHGMLCLINGGYASSMSYSIKASGNITAYSDERLKTNWRNLDNDFISKLAKVKSGIYDRLDRDLGTQVGVSAQSLQEILPEAIEEADDEMKTLSVHYGNAAMASAVELAKEVVDLKSRITQLETIIDRLQKEFNK